MTNTTSLSLLDRVAHGGGDADWTRLLAVYRPFIEQQVRTYPDLANHADDIVQEVALVLMRELPVFQRERQGSFRSWLRNITVNQLRMAARKVRRQPRAAGARPDVLQQIDELADPTSQASAKWDREHDQVILRKVLDSIRPEFETVTWQAFVRYGLQGEPARVVAESLGISVNAVMLAKSRVLRRARLEAAGMIDD